MGGTAEKRRRWLGVLFLLAALGMLLLGQTLLRERFGKIGFLAYWLACFGFTFLAILVALLDALAIRRGSRSEQRAFLEQTLREIADKQKHAKDSKPSSKHSSPGEKK